MDRETYRRVLIHGLIFVLGIALGVSLWATVKGDIGDKPIHYCPNYQYWWEDQCIPYWKWIAFKTASDPTAFFNFFLMLFTGGLWVSTYLLWRAGERQMELTREALRDARIINGAQLHCQSGIYVFWENYIIVELLVSNTGQTPANSVSLGIDLLGARNDLIMRFRQASAHGSHIAANGTQVMTVYIPKTDLIDQDLPFFLTEKLDAQVIFRIGWLDAFGDERYDAGRLARTGETKRTSFGDGYVLAKTQI